MEQLVAKKVGGKWMVSNGQTLREFAVSNGLNYVTLHKRVFSGETITKAVEVMKRRPGYRKILITYNGKQWTINDLANSTLNTSGCTASVLRSRLIDNGWSIDRALTTPADTSKSKPKYVYKGKIYRSKKHMCDELGLNPHKFNTYYNAGFSLDEVVKLSLTKEITLLEYKGKKYTLKQLAVHPDNVHGLSRDSIRERVFDLRLSVEEAFSIPKRPSKRRVIEYRGKVYHNLLEFLRSLGLHDYSARLSAIYDDEMLFEQVEKLLSTK